jgi:hypothetical protein
MRAHPLFAAFIKAAAEHRIRGNGNHSNTVVNRTSGMIENA